MKKRYSVIALLMMCMVHIMVCGYTNTYDSSEDKVYDNAGLLTDAEISELQSLCTDMAAETKLDVVIATTDDAEGKTSTEYADDFYDENGFGYDQGGSGILMLIDMDNREVWLSTKGIAIEYFGDDDIEEVLDDIFVYMEDEDYYDSCRAFVKSVGKHVEDVNDNYYSYVKPWFEGNYTDYKDYVNSSDYKSIKDRTILANPLIDLLISASAALVAVLIMAHSQKAKQTVRGSDYMDRNKFRIYSSRDIYTRTTVTKTKIESNDSGGHSGGSFHSGSSGSSHGGGGRSF